VVFAVAAALSYVPGLQGVGPLTTVIFIRIFAARLHDFGRSGWWQLILYAALVGAIELVAATDQPAGVMLAVGLSLQLVFTIVLGVIPGNRGPNRFGPEPNHPSPMASSEAFR
jgi:uncharacterized membrane protein YhaH (DUF805 family)